MTSDSAAGEAHLLKFQELLRELFQFDCADLDFGIYRIMNHKRDAVEKFISEQLPARIAADLETGRLAHQSRAAADLEEARQKVLENFGSDAIDADDELDDKYSGTPRGRDYLEAKAAAEPGLSPQAVETAVYNHLYSFFSRYYQDGDFVSKRRYGRNQRYAIPYNGEEVYLHWANSDQYYVKTAEHFNNYDWKTPTAVSVHFRLEAANVEQDNVKGDRRFFVPLAEKTAWDADARAVTVPFEYRPLTVSESTRYGKQRQQGKIITAAVSEIPQRLPKVPEAVTALTGEHRRGGDDEPVSRLEHHLLQYTRRNDSDFFIHKDLRGFLSRELDFYLKNEVLNLDNLEAAGEQAADGWFQQMRLIKSIGREIIDFLAQIEDFQKVLWEKRKFVVDTQYCVTMSKIDPGFYSEIVDNDGQWNEWRELLGIDDADRSESFLKERPTLQLDTCHFDADFIDRLLASVGDLDGMTDGILVHSENWQALRLVADKYDCGIDCVYIDPPYNSGQINDFIYKDSYRHSSWMSMMMDRFSVSRKLVSPLGGIFVSTDDAEYANLKPVLEQSWGADNFVADVIWNSRKSVSSDTLISVATNHTTFFASNKMLLDASKDSFRLPQPDEGFSNPDNDPLGPWTLDPMDAPNIRENLTYPIVNPSTGQEFLPPEGRCWRFEREETRNLLLQGRVLFGRSGRAKPMYKRYLSEARSRGKAPTTLWDDVKTTTEATKVLLNLFGTTLPRTDINSIKPKPNEFVERCAILLTDWKSVTLDYFAGSGTTGHAVINLNREDGGQRKFILVEMGEYFDTVLLPRIKKVTYSPEWKDGRPKRVAKPEEAKRSPRIVKYMRLESYEDALDGIGFDEEAGQLDLEDRIDGYLLKYMLRWETKQSETLLNAAKLTRPFDYRLRTHANGEARERTADVAETFNYLLGLNVSTRRVYDDDGRRYLVYRGETREAPGHSVAVVWRETEGWKQEDFARDRSFVDEQGLVEDGDVVYVNGDSCIPGAKAIEPVFKARMFSSASA